MKKNIAKKVHQLLGFSPIFTTSTESPKKKTKYLFYPGCSFPSYSPEGIESIIKYLNEKLDGEVASLQICCGKPTKSMGQKDKFTKRISLVNQKITETGAEELLVACQNCFVILNKYGNIRVTSLWEKIARLGVPDLQKQIGLESDIVFNIHDSCPTRKNTEIYEGVRSIMDQLGYKYEELSKSGIKTECCGLGEMAFHLSPKKLKTIMTKRASSSTTGHIVSYCAACRTAMEIGGADSTHLADLIFKPCYKSNNVEKRNKSVITQWKSRYKSKINLINYLKKIIK